MSTEDMIHTLQAMGYVVLDRKQVRTLKGLSTINLELEGPAWLPWAAEEAKRRIAQAVTEHVHMSERKCSVTGGHQFVAELTVVVPNA
ncbi:hypothetical protein ACUN0C_20160 [Faunimonas sp. B44]|uniref:hypothetical protein n=1 Tax=Faunimonas sp. B44 TaxID=3461493 RepID=UPI0040440185